MGQKKAGAHSEIQASPLLSSLRYLELPESYGQFLWAPKAKWCWHPGGCGERALQAGREQWGSASWRSHLAVSGAKFYNLRGVICHSF